MSATAHRIALADQVQAAASDARRVLTQAGNTEGTTLHNRVCDPWIRGQAQALADALQEGTLRACGHLAQTPGIGHAAVWHPGLIVCPRCTHHLHPSPAEDTTCDRCRKSRASIHPTVVTVGPILLSFGLCRRCARAAGIDPPTSTTNRRGRSR